MHPDSRSCEPFLGGLTLIAVALLSWVMRHVLAPALLHPGYAQAPSSTDWYLWVLLTVGFFHLVEAVAGIRLFRFRYWMRWLGAWRIRRHSYPDAMAHPSWTDPDWARPTVCRCGQVRPATQARCHACGRIH